MLLCCQEYLAIFVVAAESHLMSYISVKNNSLDAPMGFGLLAITAALFNPLFGYRKIGGYSRVI
jgi:hypothetical protein